MRFYPNPFGFGDPHEVFYQDDKGQPAGWYYEDEKGQLVGPFDSRHAADTHLEESEGI